ncbi:MAG: histidine kinase [Spirochaetales bacterium]|nr:histidine kinase [Leptospiraceae bacterium]MCP5482163.1 histidine kinase [Spirochaetales bacterium]MCP5484725.1 histidine kinase [Spirochaetales bacterium]
MPPGTQREIYMRFSTQGSMILPVEIMTADKFHAEDHDQQLALGLYYGILLVLTIYNLILYFLVRERAYLYYLLYITGFGIFQMNLNGLSFEYLWPGFPAWNNHVLPLSIGWAFLWAIFFAMELLETRRNTPGLHLYLKVLTIPFLLLIALTFFPQLVSYHARINFGAGLMIFFGISVFTIALRVWSTGYRPARYFVIAWVAFLTGMVMYALKAFGVIPSTALTENGMQFGSAVEMSLLSLGLADRINIINEEKEEARRREQEARLRVARYQFDLLKKSIQPHFILNSLNATAVWLKEDPEQAASLLHSLADELRIILNVVERQTVRIDEEIALCRAHLAVMSLRQDCSFTLVEKNIRQSEQIPPMVFHTLIENGITHGFYGRNQGRFVLARQRGRDRTRYILFNDGDQEEHDSGGTGLGLRYVETRLEECWPGRWALRAGPTRGGWRVVVDLFDQPRGGPGPRPRALS